MLGFIGQVGNMINGKKKSSYLRNFLLHLCLTSIIPPLLLSLDAVQFSLHLSNLGLSKLLGVAQWAREDQSAPKLFLGDLFFSIFFLPS